MQSADRGSSDAAVVAGLAAAHDRNFLRCARCLCHVAGRIASRELLPEVISWGVGLEGALFIETRSVSEEKPS